MTTILAESFDSPNPAQKWNAATGAATVGGRNGKYWALAAGELLRYAFPAADQDDLIVVGYAWYTSSSLAGGYSTIFQFKHSTASGDFHVQLQVGDSGKLRLTRNDGAGTPVALVTTNNVVVTPNSYYYIEVKVRVHDTSGTAEVRVNGVSRASVINADTKNGASTTVTHVEWNGISGGSRIDDLYVLNEQGSSFNNFLGDIIIEASIPNGAGNSAQMTAFGGAASDQAALTDASDTTGLEETTDTEKTTLAHSNLTNTTLPVLGVQVWARAKIEVAPAAMNLVARSGATETDSAEIVITNAYAWYQNTFATKPGGGAWAASDVDAAEFGIKAQV